MRALIAGVIACLTFPAVANEWSIDDMNRTIDQTNFIVGEGCSGTLISLPQRFILTAYHCIDPYVSSRDREVTDANGVVKKVRFRHFDDVGVAQNSYSGFTRVGQASYIAEIVAEDKKRDLAVLKIKGTIPHTYASHLLPADKSVQRGERVYIIGNPAGNDSTVVEGIVSNVNRTFEFPWTGNEKLPMIQISGGIFGGNSGGSVYNASGDLIGVPAAGYSSATFIGLAIPVGVVRQFMRDNCIASAFENADDEACKKELEKKKKARKEEDEH